VEQAFAEDVGFAEGLNVQGGKVVHKAAAESLGMR